MRDAFTVLWNNDRVRIARTGGLVGKPLPFLFGGPHVSQPSFLRAGVRPGDRVHPIFVKSGVLHVLASLVVERSVTVEEFISERPGLYPPDRRGRWPGETLEFAAAEQPWLKSVCWTCSDHVLIAGESTPLSLQATLPPEALSRLTFRSKKAVRPVKGLKDGKLAGVIGLQGIYRLTESSANDLHEATSLA